MFNYSLASCAKKCHKFWKLKSNKDKLTRKLGDGIKNKKLENQLKDEVDCANKIKCRLKVAKTL